MDGVASALDFTSALLRAPINAANEALGGSPNLLPPIDAMISDGLGLHKPETPDEEKIYRISKVAADTLTQIGVAAAIGAQAAPGSLFKAFANFLRDMPAAQVGGAVAATTTGIIAQGAGTGPIVAAGVEFATGMLWPGGMKAKAPGDIAKRRPGTNAELPGPAAREQPGAPGWRKHNKVTNPVRELFGRNPNNPRRGDRTYEEVEIKGKLRRKKKDANDDQAADALQNLGWDLEMLLEESKKGIQNIETPDIKIPALGMSIDVYTPKKLNTTTIYNGIMDKLKQTDCVLVQANLSHAQMDEVVRRVWGNEKASHMQIIFQTSTEPLYIYRPAR